LRDNLNEKEGKIFDLLYSDSELSNFAISQTLHIPVNEVEKLRKVIRNKCKRRILNTNG